MSIHPSAIIHPQAKVHESVQVGPYAVIEEHVTIGQDCVIGPHAVLGGKTTIGSGNSIGPFAVIGAPPQDFKYNEEETELIIGNDNQIREYVSIHRGTMDGLCKTTIGSGVMLMAHAHVGHDCILEDEVIIGNATNLAGHMVIGKKATISGMTGTHQFARVGEYAFVGGLSTIGKDIPPYVIAAGIRNQLRLGGINRVGLRRAGFDRETIKQLHQAYKILFRMPELLLQDALAKVAEELPDCEPARKMIDFFQTSSRGVLRNTENADK